MQGFWLAHRLYERFDVMEECGFYHECNCYYESVLLLLLRRNFFQHFLQQVPERLYSADKATLC